MIQYSQDRQARPYVAVSQNLWHDGRRSHSTPRSDSPAKMAFRHELPAPKDDPGRMLKKPAGSIIALIFETLLCVVALCFVALGLIALCIRNRPTGDSLGSAMEQAMKLGPTVYPILFAALLSRSLKSVGRYLSQRSVRLSTLWAFMNTNATADPLLHLVSMPSSLLVWGLLVLWVMSPLGGQSTIRLLYKTNLTETNIPELRYWDNGPLGAMFTYVGIVMGNDGAYPLSMRDIYFASLMQSINTKAGPLDQWGNIKIPRLDAGNTSAASADGWMPLMDSTRVESFTSLFGMPIVNLPEVKKQGDLHFTIESTYLDLSCSPVRHRESFYSEESGLSIGCEDCYQTSTSGLFFRSQRYMGLPTEGAAYNSNIDMKSPNYTAPRSIQFNSTYNRITSLTTCKVTQNMVESFIECVDGKCATTKVRPSVTDHRPKNYTIIDYWATDVLRMITSASQRMTEEDVIWGSSTSELFLNDPTILPLQTGINEVTTAPGGVNLYKVDADLIAIRASILLNTGVQAFMAPTAFAGGLSTNLSLYGPSHIPANGLLAVANQSAWNNFSLNALVPPGGLPQAGRPFIGASTNATLTRYTEVYRPDYVWVIILIVSSAMLFAAGVSGITVRMMTMAPNIFDPVIGLTYNNPYMAITSQTDSPLDADERARVLRSTKVQFGSVDDDGTAKAVFGEATNVEPLKLGVPYH